MISKIEKSRASGTATAPPSKSMAHRLLIAAAMCEDESVISSLPSCEDVLATIECLRALGVKIEYNGSVARVRGVDFRKAAADGELYCRESGSTLRFLIPLALLSGQTAVFSGTEKLISRPQDAYESLALEKGFYFARSKEKIEVKGPISAGEYRVRGDISSQFITGLIFALSALSEDSRIVIEGREESRSYVELTRAALATFGVEIIREREDVLFIRGAQKFTARSVSVEGDYSGAVFLEAFNLFGGEVRVEGLSEESLQGDRAYREHLKALLCPGAVINLEDCPDLAPILFTAAAMMEGGRFLGTRRLKMKESDRARAMQEELFKFGAELIVLENEVVVKKCALHAPSEPLSSHNDHRVVMSLALISSLYGAEIVGAEAVAKSYPEYFDTIKKLGINLELYET